MATGSKLWRRISIHEVVLTWVRAEIGRFRTSTLKDLDGRLIDKLVFAPDLQSSIENRLRLRMLYMTRLAIISEIPPDTLWHVVRNFRHDDVMGLFVLNSLEWVGADGDNRIVFAARGNAFRLSEMKLAQRARALEARLGIALPGIARALIDGRRRALADSEQ